MRINDLESPVFFRMADSLGWNGNTEVDLMCDLENLRIVITRRELVCAICGQGAFGPLISVKSHLVCERCAAAISRQLEGYYHREGSVSRDRE